MRAVVVNNNLIHKKCPCCQSDNIKLHSGGIQYPAPILYSTTVIELENEVDLFKCYHCKSFFIQNAIIEQDVVKLYTSGQSSTRWNTDTTFEEEKTTSLIKVIEKYLSAPYKVLDIGCSTGRLIDFIRTKGISQTYGIEYSEEASTKAREKGHIIANSISGFEKDFDIIFAFDLIEHIYDISSFLDEVYNALKINGIFIILTGDPDCLSAKILKRNWWYFRFPEHVVFPSLFFYKQLNKFKIIEYKKVHNAKSYHNSLLKFIFKFIYYYRKNGKYTGLPSMVKDHHLLVLRKNDI